MIDKILLKQSPKHKPQPIEPVIHLTGKYAYIILGPAQIGGQAGLLAAMLRQLADQLEQPIVHSAFDRVLTITPAEVVDYFKKSPILREMASDVQAVLENANLGPSSDFQLNQDLRAVQHLSDPSLADISEVLTGDRVYGGATYKRVKLVQEALKTTSTAGKETSTPVENRKAA